MFVCPSVLIRTTRVICFSFLPPWQRSTPDEQLIEAAIKAGPQDGHMFIYDARTFSAATGNKMMVCLQYVDLHPPLPPKKCSYFL